MAIATRHLTGAQVAERALDRARDEHLRAWRLADGRYLVKSRTSARGSFHLIAVGADGVPRCDCPGFYYRESCAHAAAVTRRLAREAPRQAECPAVVRPDSATAPLQERSGLGFGMSRGGADDDTSVLDLLQIA